MKKAMSATAWLARMEWFEEWGYLTASLSFLALGMFTFIYGWYFFFTSITGGVVDAALHLTNNLLFVVILLELFRSLLNFLKSHVVTLEPFLVVGVIAGIRKILTGGAQVAQLEVMPDAVFYRHLIDMGANLMIIITLVIAYFFYRRSVQAPQS